MLGKTRHEVRVMLNVGPRCRSRFMHSDRCAALSCRLAARGEGHPGTGQRMKDARTGRELRPGPQQRQVAALECLITETTHAGTYRAGPPSPSMNWRLEFPTNAGTAHSKLYGVVCYGQRRQSGRSTPPLEAHSPTARLARGSLVGPTMLRSTEAEKTTRSVTVLC